MSLLYMVHICVPCLPHVLNVQIITLRVGMGQNTVNIKVRIWFPELNLFFTFPLGVPPQLYVLNVSQSLG